MQTRIQKWGNSLAVRIPKVFASEAGLEEESLVEVSLAEGKLIVTPVPGKAFTLGQLLSGITEENIHREIATGDPAGNEAW